jgi:hypothetical protein
MRKSILVILLGALLVTLSGCDVLNWALSDINGWDVTTCGHYPGACWEFFWDNTDMISTQFPGW